MLLRSDGHAVAFGGERHSRREIPELEPGATYVQVSAGLMPTVLLRNDGRAVACNNVGGQCDIPELEPGASYV